LFLISVEDKVGKVTEGSQKKLYTQFRVNSVIA